MAHYLNWSPSKDLMIFVLILCLVLLPLAYAQSDNHVALCHKNFLQFWRLSTGVGKGDWHLLNAEDKRFLKNIQECVAAQTCTETKVEYFTIEGELPK